jgi:predicted phosphodiesterase
MNYKKAVLIVIISTALFSLLIGGLYYLVNRDIATITDPVSNSQDDGLVAEVLIVSGEEDSEVLEEKVSTEDILSIENSLIGTSTTASTIATSTGIQQKSSSLISASGLTSLSSSTYIVAFVGDIGISSSSKRVLSLIKEEASAAVILGDFDYADRADLWTKILDEKLGKTFPLIMVIGNHDEKKWAEYIVDIKKRLAQTPSVTCRGDIAIKSVCAYKDMRILISAPGIASLKTASQVYADYISTEGKGLGDKTWNICAWHKNQKRMQVGEKGDSAGWEPYEACSTLGYPIMTAHEHTYSRTFLFSNIKTQELNRHESIALSANAGLTEAKTIDQLKLAPGKTFVAVSGLGGKSIRPQMRSDIWWSAIYTSTQRAKPGALFCAFNYKGDTKRALCYFKNIDGEVKDVFVMER